MGYSDFTLDMLWRGFGIKAHDRALFDPAGHLEPSEWLRQALKTGMELAVVSEKARSEFIVAPILLTCREILERRFRLFSGIRLDADVAKDLKGECDFIFARSDSTFVLRAPLLLIVEAKRDNIEEGLGQCTAQLLGAKIYNEKDGTPTPVLYGCVTTGEMWQFLKLENGDVFIHPKRFAIDDVGTILWFLVQCLKDADRPVVAETAA